MKNKAAIFIVLIISIGLFLRIYRIADTILLGPDQAMAYIMADRIVNKGHILLVGPINSVSPINILAPTYYYLLTLLYFFLKSEIAVSLVFAGVNTFAIYLVFIIVSDLFNRKSALISAHLFAVSNIMIDYSRNIWEPHLVPFFILLSIYFLIKAYERKKTYFITLSIFAFFISLMYVSSYLLFPLFILIVFILSWKLSGKYGILNSFYKLILIFILFYSTVYYYELKNNFPSLAALKSNNSFSLQIFLNTNYIKNIYEHFSMFVHSIFFPNLIGMKILLFFIITIPLILKSKNISDKLLSLSIIFAFGLSSFYDQQMYPHRFAAIYPLFFILIGSLLLFIFKLKDRLLNLAVSCIVSLYIINNFINYSVYVHFYQNYYYNLKNISETANRIINFSNSDDISLYIMAPDSKFNYDIPAFVWSLEKINKESKFELNKVGNWIDTKFDFDKRNLILVCAGYKNNSYIDCFDYVLRREKISEVNFETLVLNEVTVYKIRKVKD